MRGLILLTALLASAAPAAAQESVAAPPPEASSAEPPASDPPPLVDLSNVADSPKPADAAPTEPPAPKQPFAVTLFLTHDYDAFIRAWAKGGEASLPTTTSIGLANPVFGMIAVSGCRPRADGKCNMEMVWRTAGPDEKFDDPDAARPWLAPPPPGDRRMLSPASFRLALDRQDPPGRYTIEVKVTDTISGDSMIVTGTLLKPTIEAGR